MERNYFDGKLDYVGFSAESSQVVTAEDVDLLGKISGDYNPLHFDEEYIANTPFRRRIVHGLFCQGLISKIIGMDMPGKGTVFISEEIKFLNPVYIGDTITAKVEISRIWIKTRKIKVSFNCKNQKGKKVVEGSALLKVLPEE